MRNTLILFLIACGIAFGQQKPPAPKKPNVPVIKDEPKPKVPLLNDTDGELLPVENTKGKSSTPAKPKPNVPIINDGPKTNVPPVSTPPPPAGGQKNTPKPNVPIIEDGPKTKVPRLDEPADGDLLPVESSGGKPTTTPSKTKTKVPRLDEPADGDLLPVESKEGKTKPTASKPKANVPLLDEPDLNDLLDVTFPGPRPATPNAGKRVFDEIGLKGSFTFNKKISFLVKSAEGVYSTYFYLNTQNGYAMMDWKALKNMIQEQPEGEMTQILTPASHFYQYVKSSEGNFVMKMGNNIDGPVMQNLMSELNSKRFFQTFKRTKNQTSGTKFRGVEYTGKDDDGNDMSVWLSDPRDVLLDTKYTYDLVGFFGLGFVASPSGRTYMITGLQGSGASIFMTDITNASASFSGSSYKPIGDMMAAAMANANARLKEENQQADQHVNEEEDPSLRAIKQRQAAELDKIRKKTATSAEQFAKTSDLQDLPFIDAAYDEKSIKSNYEIMLLGLDQAIREHELSAAEARKNNDTRALSRATCLRSCVILERTRQERLREEHLGIVRKYKNDEDKRQTELDKFFERSAKGIKPCNCD